jgi:Tol biopolymer transport system component
MPGTNTVIHTTMDAGLQRLRVVDQNGTVSAFIASPPATMHHQAEPTPSADGNWIFFSAYNDACGSSGDYCIHRATKTGSSPTLLGAGYPSRQPAPSPDGSKVAFTRSDFSGDPRSRRRLEHRFDLECPRTDGSGVSPLTGTDRHYASSPISWSTDGKWIIAQSFFGVLDLIDVATGASLPMPATESLVAASLK